jgi:hypothetical protein
VLRAIAVVLLAVLISGCGTAPVATPVVNELKHDADDLDFWHTLSNRPVATNDDTFHGLLLYLDGSDSCTTYMQRITALRNRGLIDNNFHARADEAVERGTLAVAVVKILNLKGGLTMQLFGASPRYALRELEYRRIYPESSEHQVFSGAEFVGIIGRIEDFKEGDPANVPAKVLYVGGPVTPPNSIEAAEANLKLPPVFLSMVSSFALQPAEPASQPTTSMTLPEGPLKMIITGVKGNAQYRIPPEQSWTKAEKDVPLAEGAELRTGPKSAVQLQIRPDQTITVDRLGVVKIDRATLEHGKFVTSVSMPYGRTRYDIDAANREYDATVRSPNSTLGIRGTQVSLLDQRPFPPEAVSLTGQAQFRNIRRQLVALGAKGQGKAKMTGEQNDATEYALDESVVDPVTGVARTQSEQALITDLAARGAVFSFDREIGLPVVTGGTVPRTDAELIPLLPGKLDFVIRWDKNVDFNIGVITPVTNGAGSDEILYPAPGLVQSKTGGKIAFDHRGGPNGGVEVVHWDATHPFGPYTVLALNQSNNTARARIDAYLDGKHYNSEIGDKEGTVQSNLLTIPGVELSNEGYEYDVPPFQILPIFYDVEDPGEFGVGSPAGAKVSAKKAKKQSVGAARKNMPPVITPPQPGPALPKTIPTKK